MTAGLLSLADGSSTQEPHLTAVYLARIINREMGGALVGPWDVGELPEEWLDVFRGLSRELPAMRAGRAEVAKTVAEMKKARGWR